ncbi:hypothetical protein F2P81_019232 [Scophthalmus maximus]|uniref:Uncharacterized protein n=1 Tax=Scophthalmus maximus TaxID=52904 RepID=A0A6A4S794_SCOMX|nr:hypothetical protein F2P81_019232 [Scophthalmus maximus]
MAAENLLQTGCFAPVSSGYKSGCCLAAQRNLSSLSDRFVGCARDSAAVSGKWLRGTRQDGCHGYYDYFSTPFYYCRYVSRDQVVAYTEQHCHCKSIVRLYCCAQSSLWVTEDKPGEKNRQQIGPADVTIENIRITKTLFLSPDCLIVRLVYITMSPPDSRRSVPSSYESVAKPMQPTISDCKGAPAGVSVHSTRVGRQGDGHIKWARLSVGAAWVFC